MIGPFALNDFYLGDVLELLPQIPDKSINLIITDSPIGVDFKHKLGFYNKKDVMLLQGIKTLRKKTFMGFP